MTLAIQSKRNGLIIGNSQYAQEVTKLGNGEFAEFVRVGTDGQRSAPVAASKTVAKKTKQKRKAATATVTKAEDKDFDPFLDEAEQEVLDADAQDDIEEL